MTSGAHDGSPPWTGSLFPHNRQGERPADGWAFGALIARPPTARRSRIARHCKHDRVCASWSDRHGARRHIWKIFSSVLLRPE